MNFYEEGGCTPFGMHLRQNNIARTWYECKEHSDYEHRLEQVREFNRVNKYRKRGIYMMPTRFGIGFGLKQLNQVLVAVWCPKKGVPQTTHSNISQR
ncbi:hypothetical protein ANCDUO_26970 [Ancylostoma duodenale]|uniref:Uncharacterized protein n=1 Tax=Ancylostoma duodenale TaxID=51022 RepID=A0A0C2FDB0_9BILA|nr:hypothetical protein ANCDUO_26970 [Ancylostoma duodenale]